MTKRVEDQTNEWQEKYHKAHAQLKVKKMDRTSFDNTLAVVREIRKDEREKVLDKVRTRLSKLKTAYPTGADFVWWLVIDTALNELRQSKEEQG